MIDTILEQNAEFVRDVFEKDPDHFEPLKSGQKPQFLWIGCSDSRVAIDHITGARPGTIFVHRNVANIISFNDNNFGAIVRYSLAHLGIREVVVCGHYFCGGLGALASGIDDHVIQDWINTAHGSLKKAKKVSKERGLDETATMELLTQLHVRKQISHLKRFALVKKLIADGEDLKFHGLVYDFRTGRLEKVPEDPVAALDS